MADVIAIVADGMATCKMADINADCGRWNSHFIDGWCYCHCGRWNSHIGWNVFKADLIALVADGIATIEQACSKLNQGESEELRVEVKKALEKAERPPLNTSKEEYKALNELKKDNSRMILTADKGWP